jgi:hypothetical protein
VQFGTKRCDRLGVLAGDLFDHQYALFDAK